MNWKPIGGNVIIKSHRKDKTESGLFIPDSAQKTDGEIVDIGKGYYTQNGVFIESELSIGDIVQVPNSAEEVVLDGEKFFLAHEAELRIKKAQ